MGNSNPYADFGGTVLGERLVGRGTELRTIASRIFGKGGFGSIAVVGLPRIGKTSLVSEAIRRAKQENSVWRRTVVAHASVGTVGSVDSLFKLLVDDFIHSIRERGIEDDFLRQRLEEAKSATVLDFHAVRTVFKNLHRADIRAVCVLDEFDAGRRLFEDKPQCFHWLRELCSNPEFKAAFVLISKRRLQDVARLAGHESNYWANVLMTLPLKPLSDGDTRKFLSRLEATGVALNDGVRSKVLSLCGSHPFLLDAFAFHAWNAVRQNGRISIEWVDLTCRELLSDYFEQVSRVLSDGPMLSKAVQVFVGPQWDVRSTDVDALCELGVAHRDDKGLLRCFLDPFEEYLQVVQRSIDIWALWCETERVLRRVLEQRLEQKYGRDWPNKLCRDKPKLRNLVTNCMEKRTKELRRYSSGAEESILAYSYPQDLYDLMVTDWKRLGAPLLGSDHQRWAVKFNLLSRVRTPLAHNRHEAVSAGERDQAKGICQEILDLSNQYSVHTSEEANSNLG